MLSRLCGGFLSFCALSGPGVVACAQDPGSGEADLRRFDVLNERGWNIPHPSVADTILGDVGGVRSALADSGIGFYGIAGPYLFEYDLSQSNAGKPFAVNGQAPTWDTAYQALFVTFDLGRAGLEGGQLIASVACAVNSLQQVNGPDYCRIRDIAYNQILAGGKIEVQAGRYVNDVHFVGTEVGGSLAEGALGPQAVIPYEVGLSYGGFGTPAAEVKLDLGRGVYNRVGVQRSLPPGGGQAEVRLNPGAGLKFAPNGAGVLFINELGYQKSASRTDAYTWIRVGGMYNTTRYPSFTNGRGLENWALYALADRQLTSVSPSAPYRGLYVGASLMYAPPEQNLFSRYYEARIYDFGPCECRPNDFASLVVSYEAYSRAGRDLVAPPPVGAFSATTTVIGSYAFRIRPGLYLQPGLGVTVNPSVSRAYDSSFNFYLGANAFF